MVGGGGACRAPLRPRLRAAHAAGLPVALGCAVVAAGLATAAIKARLLDHPVLRATAYSVSVKGFVEAREERERSDRIVVRVTALDGARLSDRPDRIRLSVRKGLAPPVGAFVALKARINPPSSPFRPGGYDLARDLYFHGIGATGLTLGAIRVEAPPQPGGGGLWLQSATVIAAIRDAIDAASAQRCRATPARSPRR
jgi:competence protein ComEC